MDQDKVQVVMDERTYSVNLERAQELEFKTVAEEVRKLLVDGFTSIEIIAWKEDTLEIHAFSDRKVYAD